MKKSSLKRKKKFVLFLATESDIRSSGALFKRPMDLCKKFTLVERPSSLSIYFPRCTLPYCLVDVSGVILEPF